MIFLPQPLTNWELNIKVNKTVDYQSYNSPEIYKKYDLMIFIASCGKTINVISLNKLKKIIVENF